MAFANFQFYTETFKGTAIENETDFNTFATLGAEYISASIRQGGEWQSDVQVKKCNCRIAEILFFKGRQDRGLSKQSESVGSYSVSYGREVKNAEAVNGEIYTALVLYLGRTGLLYRGSL
jgi:hypothetical protein